MRADLGRAVLALVGVVAAEALWLHAADAGCVDLFVRKVSDAKTPLRSAFSVKVNDKALVCFRIPEESYVSLWDMPPHGDVASRLFPNELTHKQANASTRAAKVLAARDYCFPIEFPADQGLGDGKISVNVTRSLNDQPSVDDYLIPGQTARRSRVLSVAARPAAETVCADKIVAYLGYRVSK